MRQREHNVFDLDAQRHLERFKRAHTLKLDARLEVTAHHDGFAQTGEGEGTAQEGDLEGFVERRRAFSKRFLLRAPYRPIEQFV